MGIGVSSYMTFTLLFINILVQLFLIYLGQMAVVGNMGYGLLGYWAGRDKAWFNVCDAVNHGQ